MPIVATRHTSSLMDAGGHEVARVVSFLADRESGYLTGQIFSINGGLNM